LNCVPKKHIFQLKNNKYKEYWDIMMVILAIMNSIFIPL
jgi:hypothetical protein